MRKSILIRATFAGALGALLGYAASSGDTMLALIASIALIPVAFAVRTVRRGEVLFNKMHARIKERAASRALAASMIVIASITIIIVWPTLFNIYILPYEVVEKLCPGLGLSLAILLTSLGTFYAYYAKSKKVME